MSWGGILAVGGGAAVGAWLRWGLGSLLNPVFPTLPLGTLAANLSGGLLMGFAMELMTRHAVLSPEARLLVTTGFLGGLTTFSTFSAEIVTLLVRREYLWGSIAIASHVVARHMRRYRTRMSREVLVDSLPEGAIGDSGHARLQLTQALDHLPPTHREAIELLKLEGLSTEAAAARVGSTPGALRVRAHRAYKALRQLLGS